MDYTTYINILKDTLKKKIQLLDALIYETHQQELSLSLQEADIDMFQSCMENKESIIEHLSKLDEGFELVYERFGTAIKEDKKLYQADIMELQEYIRKVMDKSAQLQAKESDNKIKFERYLSNKKTEVRTYKASNHAVTNYYKSMSDGYRNESIFLDKKK